jgi:hypothetical protein
MDLNQMLHELRAERDKLSAVIVELEELASSDNGVTVPRSRRGRKSMGEAERRVVSERMKNYWASRRRA